MSMSGNGSLTVPPAPAQTALVPVERPDPFAITTFDHALKVADHLAKSMLLPQHLRGKPADVLVTIWTGYELGLSAMQSIRAIDLIDGRPATKAEAMAAMVQNRRDVCEWFMLVSSDDTKAVYETKRRGNPKPTPMSWTIEQAAKAGLVGKKNWQAWPAAMLRARCIAALARAVYQDVVLGLRATEEVWDDDVSTPSEPVYTAPPPPAKIVEATFTETKKPAPAPDKRAPAPDSPPPEVVAKQKARRERIAAESAAAAAAPAPAPPAKEEEGWPGPLEPAPQRADVAQTATVGDPPPPSALAARTEREPGVDDDGPEPREAAATKDVLMAEMTACLAKEEPKKELAKIAPKVSDALKRGWITTADREELAEHYRAVVDIANDRATKAPR